MKKTIKVKEWFYDKQEAVSSRYNIFIDVTSRDPELGCTRADMSGYLDCVCEEVIAESEKAIKVRLASGSVVGSCEGWECWIPKSCMAFI